MTYNLDNDGERLVPGESHNSAETIRHKSSYNFFKAVIEADAPESPRILDLGCGVGHGSRTLAEISGATILSVDASAPAISYAKDNYSAPNIDYIVATAAEFLQRHDEFDYIVSRHALEHIPNGLGIALKFSYTKRLLVNVPYMEPEVDSDLHETNPHHELNNISEKDFEAYPHAQFFFEDLLGVTRASSDRANSIICCSRTENVPPVSIELPFPAWRPNSMLELAALKLQDKYIDLQEKASLDHKQLLRQQEELARITAACDEYRANYERLTSSRAVKTAIRISELLSRVRQRITKN